MSEYPIPEDLQEMYKTFPPRHPGRMLIERIARLEADRKVLEWKPITADNLPKVGDEVGSYDPAEAVPYWRIRAVTKASESVNWERLRYTHFRAINPPAIAQAKEQG